MSPPPMNPIPDTICAATREGSSDTRSNASRSPKAYLDTSMNKAAPTPTRVCVRNPALLARNSRSSPIRLDSSNAEPSSTSSGSSRIP